MKNNMNIDIEAISTLAQIPLTEDEKRELKPQLEVILTFIEDLDSLDTTDVKPTSQVTGKVNELREDSIGEELSVDEALSNANERDGAYFVTKGVFDES